MLVLGRWLIALSPTNSFSDKAAEVQDQIVHIRRLCEELLNKNVDIIKRSNIGNTIVIPVSSDTSDFRIRVETGQHG